MKNVFGLVLLLHLGACAGEIEDFGPFALEGEARQKLGCEERAPEILRTKCMSCHGLSSPAAGLDLEAAKYLDWIDKPATGGAGQIVDRLNVEKSVLLQKLTDTPPFGAQMPLGADALSPVDRQCIVDWLTAQLD